MAKCKTLTGSAAKGLMKIVYTSGASSGRVWGDMESVRCQPITRVWGKALSRVHGQSP